MRLIRVILILAFAAATAFSQIPAIEPGVSQELAKWRSSQYSNISYKLNLTLEKMSPVLKGSMEIRVTQAAYACAEPDCPPLAVILDWRSIPGHESDSTISNVTINGEKAESFWSRLEIKRGLMRPPPLPTRQAATPAATPTISAPVPHVIAYWEQDDHLIFREGVKVGENIIKLDFTSPILTSGSAITRYIDKEDGSEYIYSLFVPSDASTAFPVFDQPDLKAKFSLVLNLFDQSWKGVSNTPGRIGTKHSSLYGMYHYWTFEETKPISTYVFAFAAGPFESVAEPPASAGGKNAAANSTSDTKGQRTAQTKSAPPAYAGGSAYVRRSQLSKFKPHAAEVFRLNREAVKYLETYFDYKFPWPKYDLVLIPEFPFGGMEHAGVTFLREDRVIFPAEPTSNEYISRANLIFHEAAHQWFGDLVTMRWFDDLWLKEGFAEFMAYKTLEKVMPEANAWKVFYERNKRAAYATDSTKGTTAIYQPIANLSAAKSAYGNIVYRKAPSFLRQAEFYLGEQKFQTAVRSFLKKHEFANAGWEDLVKEFETASESSLSYWANMWVKQKGLPTTRLCITDESNLARLTGRPGQVKLSFRQSSLPCFPRHGERPDDAVWPQALNFFYVYDDGSTRSEKITLSRGDREIEEIWGYELLDKSSKESKKYLRPPKFIFTNYQDYGYGIFLLDDKSRDYVLKNIGREKDDFLRTMMWGSLWDSVREAELDPREYVELVIKNVQSASFSLSPRGGGQAKACTLNCGETDETTIQSLLSRVSIALNYYIDDAERVSSPHVSKGSTRRGDNVEPSLTVGLRTRFEAMLLERLQNAPTVGQRLTFYRAFVSNAFSERGREALKQMLEAAAGVRSPHISKGSTPAKANMRQTQTPSGVNVDPSLTVGLQTLRSKDKFDIVTRLAILGDADAPKLLADLERTETGDDAKRYAYAARAAFPTAENKAKYFNDFLNNKDISESWIEAAIDPFNSIRHADLTQQYLTRALAELPNLKRTRKIFFVNNWLAEFIGGQRDEKALGIVNKFLADNPNLDNDLRLKILENVDVIERAVKIRAKWQKPER